jgi:predicted dehydrogenase
MPHDLSILNEIVKEDPIEISVQAKFAARLPQADIAYLSLNYQSNFIASIQASWLSPSKIRQTILTGRKKMAVYDDINVVEKVKIYDKGIDHLQLSANNSANNLVDNDREASYTQFLQYRQGDVYSPAIPATEALKIEIEHLVECIESQKVPRTDGYQGLRVVRLLEQADRLAQNNRCWVSVKAAKSPNVPPSDDETVVFAA